MARIWETRGDNSTPVPQPEPRSILALFAKTIKISSQYNFREVVFRIVPFSLFIFLEYLYNLLEKSNNI